ncbi:hypothetical protein [Marinobacterium aestuariivivens]|uniref:Uncharacterized protein n=1 Tax=Marinobacterium aestuariivivens TaxID=1698799 RepID=A0ABW2A1F2_9GAMM
MPISRFPLLLLTLLLTACAQQPSAPPVTAVELENALTAVESRLIARMNQHAEQAAVRGSDEQVRLYEEFAQLQHRLREEAPTPARQDATVERAERSARRPGTAS